MARKTGTRAQGNARPTAVRKSSAKSAAKGTPASAAEPTVNPPANVSDRAPLMTNGHIAVKRCRHGWFMINRNDRMVGLALDRYGEWCEGELALLAPLLRPGRVVVDVGAYIGTHTVFFAQKVGPSGHVYAVEPQRTPFQLLCGNVALNALTNVTCLPGMAAAESGERHIGVPDPLIAQNFGGHRATHYAPGEKVRVMKIDNLELRRCDLIKIDVEGMEPEVIAGARCTIERFRPVIYCENNTLDKTAGTIAAVGHLGYRAWWHISNYYNPDNFFGEKENLFARFVPESNMLCTPPNAKIVVEGLIPVEGPSDNWRKALERMRRGAPGTSDNGKGPQPAERV